MTPAVVCFGELLLRLSAPGYERLLQSPHLQVFFGGAEANVAAALAAFGHPAAMVSVLPDNPLGAATLAGLRSQNVDTSRVRVEPGRMGLYFYTQGAMQRPSEVIYDRTQSSFAQADSSLFAWQEILRGAKWLHVTGITAAVSESGTQAALEAMKTARQLGMRVSFDCNYRARVWGARAAQAPTILKQLCEHASILFADDRDIAMMIGGPTNAAAAFKNFQNLQWLARTQRGVHSVERQLYSGELMSRSTTVKSRAHDLSGIVERIGAGDAFVAGLLHRLLQDESNLQSAVDFATAAAAYKHSLPGDACIASVAEIEAVLADGGSDIKR